MKIFYYADENKNQFGPFSIEELKEKGISKSTLIWYEGLSEWTKAESIDELKALFVVPPPIQKNPIPQPPPFSSASSNLDAKKTIKKSWSNKTILTVLVVALVITIPSLVYVYMKNQTEEIEKINSLVLDSVLQQNIRENELEAAESLAKIQAESAEKDAQRIQDSIAEENNKIQTRQNWYNLIILTRSSYNYSKLGGISNLSLTITNNTDYLIDDLEATVSYIRNNGNIYKTETLSFHNIPAHSFQTLKAPDSNWGTSVDFLNILTASSKAFNFCFAEGNWANNSEDPYRCQ